MIRRRAAADIMAPIGNHSFRATGITAYLDSGGVHDHRNRCSRSAGIRVHNQLEQMFKIDRIQRSQFTGTRRNAKSAACARALQVSAADRSGLRRWCQPQQPAKARLASEDRAADGRWSWHRRDHAPTGKAKTVVWRWQERFIEEGVMGLWRDKTRPSRIPPLCPGVPNAFGAHLGSTAGDRGTGRGAAMAKAARHQRQFGAADLACSRPAAASGAPVQAVQRSAIRRQAHTTSSGSTSIRPTTPLFCRSMRKAKSRRWTAPSRGCR